jgi:hypothetical protein
MADSPAMDRNIPRAPEISDRFGVPEVTKHLVKLVN